MPDDDGFPYESEGFFDDEGVPWERDDFPDDDRPNREDELDEWRHDRG